MNLTASTGAEQTQLNQDRVIALRRHCPAENGTTTLPPTPSTAALRTASVADNDDGAMWRRFVTDLFSEKQHVRAVDDVIVVRIARRTNRTVFVKSPPSKTQRSILSHFG